MADQQQEQRLVFPIIDSHVHIFPESELESMNWYTPDGPLQGQHSLDEYRAAAKTSSPSLLGFVYVETDRKNDLAAAAAGDPSGWAQPLEEIRWLRRVVTGQPRPGEGHGPDDAKLCLGIVPCAPVASGPAALDKYLALAEEAAGEAWPKVKGFRFLVQDKPHGTMLQDDFIEGLKLLGRKGFVFEVGIDHHRRGKKQLEEALAMIERSHDGVPEDEQVTFIFNHLCKADLTINNVHSDPNFHAWRNAIYALGKASRTYMKLSGCFSEMPASLRAQPPSRVFEALFGWLGVVLATFGPGRIMFGSDWPVCTIDVDDGWLRWRDIVEKMCWMASLDDDDWAMIFGGTAKKAYGL